MSIERFDECNGDMIQADKGQWCLYVRDVAPELSALRDENKIQKKDLATAFWILPNDMMTTIEPSARVKG